MGPRSLYDRAGWQWLAAEKPDTRPAQKTVRNIQRMSRKAHLLIYGSLAVAGFLYMSTRPVWLRLQSGPLVGDRVFLVMNPLRNRTAEQVSEQFLAGIQSSRCIQTAGGLGWPHERVVLLCKKESESPTHSWELIDRANQGPQTHLRYKWYSPDQRTGSFTEITVVEKRGISSVSDYVRAY
jgi:hypothetical protein